MKLTRLLAILILSIFLIGLNSQDVISHSGFVMSESAKPEKDVGEPLDISAQTAVVIELNTGKVLYSKNAHQKVYPASTTKILTALIALEECNLDDIVKITGKASGVEGSSIYLEVGEKISYRDLLYGLMLRSGNDAAIAISEAISGSTEKFAEKMNQRAKEIGALNSNFANPSGLFNENHYTTAYDMALIAREAMKNPEFRQIASAKSHVANRGE
ncbi:MAG: D-alanyl-D-alanine carboxypeptidase [Clostridiales bacterium]|nr:D-alanyl-D-alanine carboxypeptidase [Clostridiales bacterium]